MIDYLGFIGNTVGFLMGTPKMTERFKVSVITTYLDISRPQEIVFQSVPYTRGKMSDGHASLCICPIDSEKGNQSQKCKN